MTSVFIFIDWFYPAYKAGGPVQSITNLILALEEDYDFYVITSAYDLHSKDVMQDIQVNTWNTVRLPGSKKNILVWYTKEGQFAYQTYKQLLIKFNPDIIYLNGLFSFRYFIIPLILIKNVKGNGRLIICPRGMLQKGALAGKRFKKRVYLQMLKLSGLVKNASWHATNLEEKADISKQFGFSNKISIVMNIPRVPVDKINIPEKTSNNIRIIYLSLVTKKKNLLFLLEIIYKMDGISLDIYGPVKDILYWKECKKLISKMPEKIRYNGDILPFKVQEILTQYHALAILTKGENFGHALYESLSVGRPIITSNYTPWNNLQKLNAGWNVDIYDEDNCIAAFTELKEMHSDKYFEVCTQAYKLAGTYYNLINIKNSYKILFS